MKYYSYENFRNDTKQLIEDVKNFQPEAILAVARGGLTLSHAMAEGMDIRDVQSLRTELYDKEQKREDITMFGGCSFPTQERVLVVDDIADSGETLQSVMSYLRENFKGVEFKSCALFYKKTSVYEPHFWINEADDWIDFFWERDFIS